MERSVRRILHNEAYIFFVILLVFSVMELTQQDYLMATVMLVAALVMIIVIMLVTRQRQFVPMSSLRWIR